MISQAPPKPLTQGHCDHGLSNALIESTNTKIRLLQRIAFGLRSAEALIGLAILTLGGFRPSLPRPNRYLTYPQIGSTGRYFSHWISRAGSVVVFMPTTETRTMAERARAKAWAHLCPRPESLDLLGRVFQMSWIDHGARRAG